ncbi:hypothetical protein V866_004656 [Kwoniella sp. B9012]|uniref:DUF1996 domain-containing protein n=1 Tax=Kwoniella europaea PYCC6329 TaxID=1423913 RepID=A0AAX4KK71_9TREE
MSLLTLTSLSGLLFLLSTVAADPFFVVQHGNAVVTSRRDPIISPGGISGHLHSIVGSSSFKPSYEYQNSINGKCTSANVNVDKSNYWVPQLYRKLGEGQLELVKMNRVNTYYFIRRSGPTEQMYEFPKGMKMLAGNPFRNTFDANDPAQAAVEYVCLGTDDTPMNTFPERSCPDDLRAQVTFPNCWDGQNPWLEGSKHVSYPASGRFDAGGPCPSTHPYRIPTLFFEYHFNDKYDYTPGARVWAQGDDIGYGFHGDFTMGWPEGLFTEIVNAGESCAVLFEVGNCPPLKQYFTGVGGGTCQPDDPSVVVNEDIGLTGPVARLPGDNPIWNGGAAPNKSGSSSDSGGAATSVNSAAGINSIPASGSSSAVGAAASSPAAAVAVPPTGSSTILAPLASSAPASAPTPAATTSSKHGGWGGWGGKRRLGRSH